MNTPQWNTWVEVWQRHKERHKDNFEKQSGSLMSWVTGMQWNLGFTVGIFRCCPTQQRSCSSNSWFREKSGTLWGLLWHRNLERLRLEEIFGGCPVLCPVGLWPQSTHFSWIDEPLLGSLGHLQLFPSSQWMFVPCCRWKERARDVFYPKKYFLGRTLKVWVSYVDWCQNGNNRISHGQGRKLNLHWVLKNLCRILHKLFQYYTNCSSFVDSSVIIILNIFNAWS